MDMHAPKAAHGETGVLMYPPLLMQGVPSSFHIANPACGAETPFSPIFMPMPLRLLIMTMPISSLMVTVRSSAQSSVKPMSIKSIWVHIFSQPDKMAISITGGITPENNFARVIH